MVLVSETANGGPGGPQDAFIEIANFGDQPADLDGWGIFHCGASGSRGGNPLVPRLEGVTLAPGETFMIAHQNSSVVDLADATFTTNLADDAYGAWLEDADRQMIDRIAVSPHTRDNICGPQVPADLDYKRGQSWQRVGTSGDVTDDFIQAGRTPNAPNTDQPDPGVQPSDVLVSELANGGPAGRDDNFIELANVGEQLVDVSGWQVYSCRAIGTRLTDTLQATLPSGTVIEPGAAFIVAHTTVDVPTGVAHVRYDASLEDDGFGALIEDSDGNIMDAVGVYETDGVYEPGIDSPCTQGTALPNRLDYGFGESYQRVQSTGDNAADFVKASRTIGEFVSDPVEIPEPDPVELGAVQISEVTHSGQAGITDNFFELANYGDEAVSLAGWSVDKCERDGRRATDPLIDSIGEVTLEPGQTFLAVHESSPVGGHDAVYAGDLDTGGFGLIVYDGSGDIVDSVGVYPTGHVTSSFVAGSARYSPCTKVLSMLPSSLETEIGDSYQRYQSTGSDVQDFVEALRTPGELRTDLRGPADIPAADLEPVDVAPLPRPQAPALVGPDHGSDGAGAAVDLAVTADHTTGEDVDVTFHGAKRIQVVDQATRAYTGASDEGPPAQRRPRGEQRVDQDQLPLDGTGDPLVTESTDQFPYQRYELVVPELDTDEFEISWQGRSTGRNELQLYAWNHSTDDWQLIDAGGGVHGGQITLIGSVDVASHVRGRTIDVLVQDGLATREAFSDQDSEPNLAFKDPGEYDFSFGYVADTQFLSQGFRHVFADMNRWLVNNQDARDIAYTFHVGDVVQQWMWGTHTERRARDQYQFGSDIMAVLEDAGHPYGILPGNHDNKWGRSADMFNEYFPPSRFADLPWYGDSMRPGDQTSHYDVMEIGGAKFLMVYIGYLSVFNRDPVIDWANQVIADHPDHNVIFATHEYITSAGDLTTVEDFRWTAQGQLFFDEIIRPNPNVFLALAGHASGVALNIKRDVGGVEGRVLVEMMANYQNFRKDGRRNTGFLRLLQVDLDAKQMAVNTYSPALDEHNPWEYDNASTPRYTDTDDEFSVEIDINNTYDKRVETDALILHGPTEPIGNETVGAGDEASVSWRGLEVDTGYAWYARVEDADGGEAVSPVWTFTTGP